MLEEVMIKALGKRYGIFKTVGFDLFNPVKKINDLWFYTSDKNLEHDLYEMDLNISDVDLKYGYTILDTTHNNLYVGCYIFDNNSVDKNYFETIDEAVSWFEDLTKRGLIAKFEKLIS